MPEIGTLLCLMAAVFTQLQIGTDVWRRFSGTVRCGVRAFDFSQNQ
jgi:hypothetical protein